MNSTEPARPLHESREPEPAQGTARLSTIIASAPGIMEQSLRGTLESLPSVDVVGSAAGCLSALQMVQEKQADMVVIDSNLHIEDVLTLLRQLRQQGLPTLSLVLTATKSQAQRALAAGADATVRRHSSSVQLSATVTKLSGASQAEG